MNSTKRREIRIAVSVLLLGLALAACGTTQDLGRPSAPPPSSVALPPSSVAPPPSRVAAPAAVAGTKGFEMKSLVLYQPGDVLHERVPSVKLLAAYTAEVKNVCTTYFADATVPETLDIVIAIKPGGRSRVWFVSPSRPDDDASLGRLRQQIELVKPPEVRAGPVAVAIVAAIAGADREPPSPGTFIPPMPKAWREAAAKASQKLSVPDDVLQQVWPD